MKPIILILQKYHTYTRIKACERVQNYEKGIIMNGPSGGLGLHMHVYVRIGLFSYILW